MAIDQAQALCSQLPDAAIVGQITGDRVVVLIDAEGARQVLSFDRGFQHFTARPQD